MPNVRAVVDRAVAEDVGLGAAEDVHRRDCLARFVDVGVLPLQFVFAETARVERGGGVVGDAGVFVSEVARRFEHLQDGVAAVAVRRVNVKRAAQVGGLDELHAFFLFEDVRRLA